MSGNSRKFLQGIANRISKFPLLHNATSAIENASGRAQVQLNNIQHVASEKYDTIVKQVNGSMIIQDLNVSALQKPAPIPKRLVKWWRWYQQLTGLQDVEVAQQHVIAVQDKLFKCQDDRRVLHHQLALITDKLKEIYGELVQTKRDDPKYVQLTIMENKSLQEQTRIGAQLHLLENEERDHFTQLATAIKEYHDSQAMNAQKYKYLSILASAALAIISLCGSMVYNNRRIRDVRIVIADAQLKNETMFNERFDSLEEKITVSFSGINKQLRNNHTNNAQKNNIADSNNRAWVPSNDAVKDVDVTELKDTILSKRNIWIGTVMLLLYIIGKNA